MGQRTIMAVIGISCCCAFARGDEITYVDEEKETVTVEARLTGSGQGFHALQFADGQMKLVPQQAVQERVPKEGPEPLEPDEVVKQLTERFGEETFRTSTSGPYVVGVVLTAPLPRSSERRADALLKKAVRYMKQIDKVFTSFARRVRFPLEDPVYPLVVLIFETDEEFEDYTGAKTGQGGLSAGRIAGFYSHETNFLAIRMSECQDFATPLHEAIHQQCFNRGVLQRFAPIPTWFGEGIATGFEGNGTRINVLPSKISPRYAQQAVARRLLRWEDIVTKDAAFRGDVLAGDAYTQAWCLHWLLVTKHKDEYSEFLKMLSKRPPLAEPDPDSRLERFTDIFGAEVGELEESFPQILQYAMKRQRVPFKKEQPKPGLSETDANLAHVELKAVNRLDLGGQLHVEGRIQNTSPLRPMTYHVTVETNAGTYAEWLVPDLKIGRGASLRKQAVRKLMKGGRGGPASAFRVKVRAAVPESREAKKWKNGDLPVPVVGK